MQFDLIITRHPALLTVLVEDFGVSPDTPVVAHATAGDLKDKHTLGVLPVGLAALTASHTELVLRVPPELRGTELNAQQVRQYMAGLKAYQIQEVTL